MRWPRLRVLCREVRVLNGATYAGTGSSLPTAISIARRSVSTNSAQIDSYSSARSSIGPVIARCVSGSSVSQFREHDGRERREIVRVPIDLGQYRPAHQLIATNHLSERD